MIEEEVSEEQHLHSSPNPTPVVAPPYQQLPLGKYFIEKAIFLVSRQPFFE